MFTRFHRFFSLGVLLLLSFSCGNLCDAQDDRSTVEYKIKAGFVMNFLRFVSWPDDGSSEPEVWRIGVLGNREVFKTIRDTLAEKTIDDIPVEVIKLKVDEDVLDCHVMFVMRDFDTDSWAKFNQIEHLPILIVGESKNFAHNFGMIGFIKRKTNFRLEINLTRAKKAGLVVSSKLAGMAQLVDNK